MPSTNLTNLTEVRGLSSVLRNRERQSIENLMKDPRVDVGPRRTDHMTTSLRANSQSRIESAIQTELLTSTYTASNFSRKIRNEDLLLSANATLFGDKKLKMKRDANGSVKKISTAEDLIRYLSEIDKANSTIKTEFESLDSLLVELQTLIDQIDVDNFKEAPIDATLEAIDGMILNLENRLPHRGVEDQLILELRDQLSVYSENTETGNIIDSIVDQLGKFQSDDHFAKSRLTTESLDAEDRLRDRITLLDRFIVAIRDIPLTHPSPRDSITDPVRKEPAVSRPWNFKNVVDDGAITDFNNSLNTRLSFLTQQVEKLNEIAPPKKDDPTPIGEPQPDRMERIDASARRTGSRVVDLRIERNPNTSENVGSDRARFSVFEIGTTPFGSPGGSRMILQKKAFSQSEFDRFATDNTGLLTNNYR